MAKAQETTLCLNSVNRDVAIYPQPNDFALDLRGRYEAQVVSLSTLEMPFSQHLIEEEWSTFSFDVGLSLWGEQRTQRLWTELGEVLLTLPQPYIGVVHVGDGYWETASSLSAPHGLSTRTVDLFDATILYVNVSAQLSRLRVEEADVSRVRAVSLPGDHHPPASTRGCLSCVRSGVRTFTDPEHLVAALNIQCGVAQIPILFTYDRLSMCLRLRARGRVRWSAQSGLFSTLRIPSEANLDADAVLEIAGFPLSATTTWPLQASIPVGCHGESSILAKLLELSCNAASRCCTLPVAEAFGLGFWGRPLLSVPVAAGRWWHPCGLAEHIDAALREVLREASLDPFEVRFSFDESRDAFLFEGRYQPFRIVFGDSSELESRLGFDDLQHSVTALFLQGRPRNFRAVPASVAAPQQQEGLPVAFQKRFTFVAIPLLREGRTVVIGDSADDDGRGVSPDLKNFGRDLRALEEGKRRRARSTDIAPGSAPPEYLLWSRGREGVVHWFVAQGRCGLLPLFGDFSNFGEIAAETETDPPPGELPDFVRSTKLHMAPVLGAAALNLYFPPSPRSKWSRLAEIFGFDNGANLSGGPRPLVAPHHWCMDQPSYLLFEMNLQNLSSSIQHLFVDDLRTQLFGKLVLYPPYRVERGYPLQKLGSGPCVLSQLHLRILNPWHTLYNFHGRNWSLTLVLTTQGTPVSLQCS